MSVQRIAQLKIHYKTKSARMIICSGGFHLRRSDRKMGDRKMGDRKVADK